MQPSWQLLRQHLSTSSSLPGDGCAYTAGTSNSACRHKSSLAVSRTQTEADDRLLSKWHGPRPPVPTHTMAEAAAQSRLETLARQLVNVEREGGLLQMAPTSATSHSHAADPPCYSIALPEKLTPDGQWSVFRWVQTTMLDPLSPAMGGHASLHPQSLEDLQHFGPSLAVCNPPPGRWCQICRSASSPFKLVSTFLPPADHIRTLHDNLEYACSQYPNVRVSTQRGGGRSHVVLLGHSSC